MNIHKISLFLLLFFSAFFSNAAELAVAKNKKTDWQIYSPSQKTAGVPFAISELQKYFSEISGAELKTSKNVRRSSTFIIGLRDELPKNYQALLPPRKEGFDGYAIVISQKPKCVIIAGDNGPGTIYGVYDFLERLGCRWFYPTLDANDPEVVPKRTDIFLQTNSWAVASPIRIRVCNGANWFFQMDYSAANKETDWAMKNRYNAMGWQAAVAKDGRTLVEQYHDLGKAGVLSEVEKRGMFIHGPAHSFDHFLKAEDYFEQHPEWFGVRDGKRSPQNFKGAQFCWSNAEARKQFCKNAEAFATNAPLVKIFCTIPFDGGAACACDECKKIGASNLLMILLGDVIEKLKGSAPDLMVETVGGYGAVPDPPSNLDVIHPKQRVVWAQWGRHHGVGYDDPKYDKRNLDNWRKAAKGGLTICQYYTDNFAEPWVMGPFAVAMESDRKYFLKHHVDALYMLMYPVGYWWNHSLNGYIAGRCFYDVSIDPFAEIKDYAVNYFGPKAGPLLADYYTEWAKNIDLSYRVRGDSRKQDRAMLADERKKLIDPAIEAAKNESVFAYRVAKVAKLHTLAENLTEAHRLHNAVLIFRQDGKFDEASAVLEKARVQTDKVMEMFYALADLNQGLIEKKEVPAFIKMGVKNWIDEEAKAIAEKNKTLPPNPWRQLSETEMLPADVTR